MVLVVCRFVGGSLGWVSVGPFGWLWSWSGCCEELELGSSCGFPWVVWFAGVGGIGLGVVLGFRSGTRVGSEGGSASSGGWLVWSGCRGPCGFLVVCGFVVAPWVGWQLGFVLAAVVVWLLWGVGFEFVLWASVGGVVYWCGRFWFWLGVWGGPGCANWPNNT